MAAVKDRYKQYRKESQHEIKLLEGKVDSLKDTIRRKEYRDRLRKQKLYSFGETLERTSKSLSTTFEQEIAWLQLSKQPDKAIAIVRYTIEVLQTMSKLLCDPKYKEKEEIDE